MSTYTLSVTIVHVNYTMCNTSTVYMTHISTYSLSLLFCFKIDMITCKSDVKYQTCIWPRLISYLSVVISTLLRVKIWTLIDLLRPVIYRPGDKMRQVHASRDSPMENLSFRCSILACNKCGNVEEKGVSYAKLLGKSARGNSLVITPAHSRTKESTWDAFASP